jgi:hypothetical protein
MLMLGLAAARAFSVPAALLTILMIGFGVLLPSASECFAGCAVSAPVPARLGVLHRRAEAQFALALWHDRLFLRSGQSHAAFRNDAGALSSSS